MTNALEPSSQYAAADAASQADRTAPGQAPAPWQHAPVWDCHVHVFDAAEPVLPGHYGVTTNSIQTLQAIAGRHHVGHLVLVQPSVYGGNHRLLLDALEQSGGRHRGVIVAAPGLSAGTLDHMHELGVRGVRVNLVSPVGNEWRPVESMLPHLRRLGWHVEWYAKPEHLPTVIRLHDAWQVPCVLAHLAGLTARDCADAPLWRHMDALAALGAWIKISAMYRLDAEPPYRELDPLLRRLGALFEGRLVWGSDWPHTSLPGDRKPPYADLWTAVQRVLPDQLQAILAVNPLRLYCAGA
ncbi:amidohydrolase family protein [Pigmentiphaga soli]|uniref:Amidohydrolase family protein n=1 Tax=Pigmentiphaga soli TaxID=1007095 RepID=A0ABP8GCY5_9BURK